jgi:anti-sigma regulatory factor (Ser/Thr protein kinase)
VLELSHHILDALENAVEAGASRITIRIEENREKDSLSIQIDDNGRGMDPATVEKALDPFFTTRKVRQVGLGLPLFREAARRCEGELHLDSRPGLGTRLEVRFRHSHIDRAPLGRVSSALLAILLSKSPVDLDYRHRVGRREFSFQTGEIRRELNGVPLTHPRVREWMAQFLKEGEYELYGPLEPIAKMKKRK